jgi:hypothetical protein
VKQLGSRWAAATLLALILLIFALFLALGLPPRAATNTTKGTVQVGFTSTISLPNSGQLFQRMLLNVIAVRLNPSTDATVSDANGGWQEIPAPAGVGAFSTVGVVTTGITSGGNFGPSGTTFEVGQGRSELQIELNLLQDQAQILNSASIPAKTYHHIELLLDKNNPGNFVTLCGQATPRGEGCIVYPSQLSDPSSLILVPGTINFQVSRGAVTPLVLNIDPGIQGVPVSSTDSVIINPTISLVPNQVIGGVPGNPEFGVVSGTVTNPGNKQTVTAELSGTNQIIAVITPQADGSYVLNLPAVAGGTSYDLYASAKGRSTEVASGIVLFPGQQAARSPLDFTETDQTSQSIAGKVTDACSGVGVPAATLQMLVPDPAISPAPDCAAIPAVGCVVVGSATTDDSGHFPMPGNGQAAAPFSIMAGNLNYTLNVSASGYNAGQLAVAPIGNGLGCPSSGFSGNSCSIALERGEIDATVALPGANNGPTLNVLIMAEQTGTNNVQGVGMASIPSGSTQSNPVPIFVPDNSAPLNPIAAFDFFGTVQDLFGTSTNAVPQRDSGHTLTVSAAVPGSGKCPAAPAGITLTGFTCVGHGSVAGTVTGADANTVVVLANDGVDLMQQAVPSSGVNAGQFSFCAPADPAAAYTLQHFEAQPDGTLVAAGTATAVTLPVPTAIPTPCSGICGNTSTTCSLCNGLTNSNIQ